jgi:hypothetical protein
VIDKRPKVVHQLTSQMTDLGLGISVSIILNGAVEVYDLIPAEDAELREIAINLVDLDDPSHMRALSGQGVRHERIDVGRKDGVAQTSHHEISKV